MAQQPPVTFDFAKWTTLFPEFALCSAGQGQNWFNIACLLCANSTASPLFCIPVTTGQPTALETALYLLTSHVAFLSAPRDAKNRPAAAGKPPSSIVGRINGGAFVLDLRCLDDEMEFTRQLPELANAMAAGGEADGNG